MIEEIFHFAFHLVNMSILCCYFSQSKGKLSDKIQGYYHVT